MKVTTRIFLSSVVILLLAILLSSTYILKEATGLTAFNLSIKDKFESFAMQKPVTRYGYIEKDNNGNFNVGVKLTRAEIANMIFKIENLDYDYENIFNDTEDNQYVGIISPVVKCGYMSAFEGNFMPDNYITRSQFIKVVSNIIEIDNLKLNTIRQYDDEYIDINKNEFKKEIIKAYQYGLIDGNASNKFRTNDFITKEEAIVILNKVYGYDEGDILHMLGIYYSNPYKDINNEYWAFEDIVRASIGLEE